MALRELVERYGIRLKKSLGQNLLLDDNINRIMVDAAALTREDDVVEVGAGLGALTAQLCPKARRVLAIEIDKAFMPCLEDRFSGVENVVLFRGDVLNHDLGQLVEEYLPGAERCKMVSNLPYYITTPVLFHFLESAAPFSRIVVMVQEEVAFRMTAPVGSTDYGVLAVSCRYYADVDIVHKVSRSCFRPAPRVDSCIVRLRCRTPPLYPDIDGRYFIRLVRAAFGQRRKTLRNSLGRSGDLGLARGDVLEAIADAGIDPGRRPQTLSLDEFAALARELCIRGARRGRNRPNH
ncbi:MAG TPA: 16S rRNA (adenine(1518)-N(6)/adenine(1519)-N(6))-dimethyltransferase RsmA [Candidatus Hydrogenedentes bacterium]|nr:16S rRNA (adenine(1518)-N(6)/adenine(1519)-N(6))-dimethyltransferase RsmA [Candidatus Hydrogenedentota bacterium]HIJ73955.1 16S rRNA (adenine(1518)-N(6)/adenine(1519)-N(6))-dimethyltransferase RsmA [Candidatus Hydrogenedentota bacterium]